jgi:hypothetical protein
MNKSLDYTTAAPVIVFRKNSGSSVSRDKTIMILETKEKKITVNLKDDLAFLHKNDFPRNINMMKSSVSNMESGHFSDKSLVRIQKQNDILDKIGGLDIEAKQSIEVKNRDMLRSQDVRLETPKENLEPEERVNIVQQCEINEPLECVKLNTVESNDTQNHIRIKTPTESPHQKSRAFPQIKIISGNSLYNGNIVLTQNNHDSDLKGKVLKGRDLDTQERIRILNDNEENTFEYFKLCFICDKLHLTTTTFTAIGCEHSICQKCGKTYYEDKIEQGDYSLKCPVYRCTYIPDPELVEKLLSGKHYQAYRKHMDEANNTDSGAFNIFKQLKSTNTNTDVKVYTQKHVFDVNTNDTFFCYNKARDQFCIKCGEPSLYGRTGKTYVKCLNCYNTICKFCMKFYTYDHFDITSMNYCKVYFRKTLKKIFEKPSTLKIFLLTYLMMLPSFIMFICAMYTYLAEFLSHLLSHREKTNFFVKIFYLFIYIFICICLFPCFILLMPYFPILMAIFK